MNPFCRTTLLLATIAQAGTCLAKTTPPEPRAIRDTLEQLWDSLDTLELRCEMYPLDGLGQRDRGRSFWRLDLARGSGGRMALTATSIKVSGEESIFACFREDGRRRYVIEHIRGKPGWVSKINIQGQENTADRYEGIMFAVLWLLMPGGKPLHVHLDEGGSLELPRPETPPSATLIATHKGNPLRCTLSPDHDWLAKRVELEVPGQEPTFWEVTRFDRDHGRWYPAEGTYLNGTADGRPKRWGFVVTSWAINRPLVASTFGQPPIPKGVFIHDETTRKMTYQGGLPAQKALAARFREQFKIPVPVPGPPIVASRDPDRIIPAGILAVVAVSALVFAGVLRLLRRRTA